MILRANRINSVPAQTGPVAQNQDILLKCPQHRPVDTAYGKIRKHLTSLCILNRFAIRSKLELGDIDLGLNIPHQIDVQNDETAANSPAGDGFKVQPRNDWTSSAGLVVVALMLNQN